MNLKYLIPLLALILLATGRDPTVPIGDPAGPQPDQNPQPTPTAQPQPDSLPPIGFPWAAAGEDDSGHCPLRYGWGWAGSMRWPVPGYDEFRPFGFEPGGRHGGIDVYAPSSTPVIAPVNGALVWAGYSSAGFGQMVGVASSGRVIILAHLEGVADWLLDGDGRPRCGVSVVAGDVIGYVGRTGAVAGDTHLHIELRYQGLSWNPGLWLDYR
jgi:murein DD-endopeptidase MepM/ murein hydrolase activator NlpD